MTSYIPFTKKPDEAPTNEEMNDLMGPHILDLAVEVRSMLLELEAISGSALLAIRARENPLNVAVAEALIAQLSRRVSEMRSAMLFEEI